VSAATLARVPAATMRAPRSAAFHRLLAMRPDFTELVDRARAGDASAWDAIVAGLQGIVWSTLAGFRLSHDDRNDVFAAVFFRLYERIDTIREPQKLPGWMATTTRHEALGIARSRQRTEAREDMGERAAAVRPLDEQLLDDELHVAVRAAFSRLSPQHQDLLRLLTTEPPMSYDEIAELLDIPRGSIGPTRQRCLERLRATPELQPFLGGGS
jgi:RNA polymerase sigma factor (sigma-70 family)